VLVSAGDGHRVTTLELFFDLVFVFAITQVTGYMSYHLDPLGLAEALVLLALMWWAWVAYAWLGTAIRFDEGLVRLLLFAAMGLLLVIAIGMPEAFRDEAGGFDVPVSTPTVIALAYAGVRVLHLGLFVLASRTDPAMRAAIGRLAMGVSVALVLLVVGSLQSGWVQVALYAVAFTFDMAGAYLGRGAGWALNPGHFAERHGLIVIIALGESIVAIGAGASGLPLSPAIAVTALLGLAIAACLWWVYFDITMLAAERNLHRLTGDARNRAARDAYSVLHLPMIAGIVLLALGVKRTTGMVAEPAPDLGAQVPALAAVALPGGVALYLLALVAFRMRMDHTVARPRVLAASGCLVLAGAAPFTPTLAILGAVVLVVVALVYFEYRRLGWISYHLRHDVGQEEHLQGSAHQHRDHHEPSVDRHSSDPAEPDDPELRVEP
jgi:low temperature requirement protein LtrA